MRIVALESYDTRSHRDWLRGYARASQHEVVPLTLLASTGSGACTAGR